MKKVYALTLLSLLLTSCSNSGDVLKQSEVKTSTSEGLYTIAMEHAYIYGKSGFTSKKDYEKAISGLEEVLSVERMNADAWFNMGRLFFYKRELSKAKDALKNAITYRSNFVEAYSLLTKVYLFEGNIGSALSVAERAEYAVPGNNVLMNNLAILYIRTGRLPSARKTAENIIRHDTRFTPAYTTLGNVYYIEGKQEMARFMYLKAIEAGDDGGDIYSNLGIISEQLGEKGSSMALLKKAEERSPDDPYVLNNVAEFYLSSGDYEGAIKKLNAALERNPKMAQALVNLGVAYTNVKLFDDAEKKYNEAMEYDPSFPETYFNYGLFLIHHRGENDKSLNMFNKFIALKGKEISDKHSVYRYIRAIKQKQVIKR
jgi:tetratricopeptide (TPR) repeat protein